jgi:DNA invertase Pin-like site-specific DNA recombinase
MMGEIILRVMAWAAQAELESIQRRIAVGIRRAAEEGRYPRRPKALTPEQTAAARLLRRGQSQSAVARTFGVSRQTIWRAEQSE